MLRCAPQFLANIGPFLTQSVFEDKHRYPLVDTVEILRGLCTATRSFAIPAHRRSRLKAQISLSNGGVRSRNS